MAARLHDHLTLLLSNAAARAARSKAGTEASDFGSSEHREESGTGPRILEIEMIGGRTRRG